MLMESDEQNTQKRELREKRNIFETILSIKFTV